MLFDSSAYREIYLVFMDASFIGDRWLKDGFKHVYAIERSALGWTCTDPSKSDIHTMILPAHFETDVMSTFIYNNPKCHVMRLHVKPHQHAIYPALGVISCVSVMKYMLGIKGGLILTPYQLYAKLMKSPPKHIEVIEWHDTNSTQPSARHKHRPRKPNKLEMN